MHVKMYDNQAMFRKSMVNFGYGYVQKESEDTMEDHFMGELSVQVKTPVDEIILNEKKEGFKKYFENHVEMNCQKYTHRSDNETHANALYLYFVENYGAPELEKELNLTGKEVNNIIDGYRNFMKKNKPELEFRSMDENRTKRINKRRSKIMSRETSATTYRLKSFKKNQGMRRLSKEIV